MVGGADAGNIRLSQHGREIDDLRRHFEIVGSLPDLVRAPQVGRQGAQSIIWSLNADDVPSGRNHVFAERAKHQANSGTINMAMVQFATVNLVPVCEGFSSSSMMATAKSSALTDSPIGLSVPVRYLPERVPGAITGAGESIVHLRPDEFR